MHTAILAFQRWRKRCTQVKCDFRACVISLRVLESNALQRLGSAKSEEVILKGTWAAHLVEKQHAAVGVNPNSWI